MSEEDEEGSDAREEDRLVEQTEVYRCGSELEANRVIDELLEPEGIDGFVHDRTSHSLPSPAEMGDYFIAVVSEDAERARDVLRKAREAGELDTDSGELIEGAAG